MKSIPGRPGSLWQILSRVTVPAPRSGRAGGMDRAAGGSVAGGVAARRFPFSLVLARSRLMRFQPVATGAQLHFNGNTHRQGGLHGFFNDGFDGVFFCPVKVKDDFVVHR